MGVTGGCAEGFGAALSRQLGVGGLGLLDVGGVVDSFLALILLPLLRPLAVFAIVAGGFGDHLQSPIMGMRELGAGRAGGAGACVAAGLETFEGADYTLVYLIQGHRIRRRYKAAAAGEAGIGTPFYFDLLWGRGAREGGGGRAVHGFAHGGVADVVFWSRGHLALLSGVW